MKRSFFAIFLIYTGISTLSAQVWAPVGAKWTYGTQSVVSGTIHYSNWEAVSDTVINTYTYSRIERSGNHVDGDYKDHFFAREDDNIIWLYSDSTNNFTKLFDFGASTGTWWTTEIGNCPLTMLVINSRMDTILGMPYQAMQIEYEGPDTSKGSMKMWVNRLVGGLERPLPFYEGICNNIIPDNETYTGLRCYEDTAVGSWQVDANIACQYSSVGISEQEGAGNINAYPNPFANEIYLDQREVAPFQVIIRDLSGREIRKMESGISAPVRKLTIDGPSSLYFVEIRYLQTDSSHRNQVFKLLKR